MVDAAWAEDNKRFTVGELRRLSLRVELRVRQRTDTDPAHGVTLSARLQELEQAQMQLCAQMTAPPAVLQLTAAFGLSDFERDVLMTCVGVELDAELGQRIAHIQAQRQESGVTWSFALGVLSDPSWSATLHSSPLRRFSLLECLENADGLVSQRLRVDERVLHYLVGIEATDHRLDAVATPYMEPLVLSAEQQRTAAVIAHVFADAGPLPVVMLAGRHAQTSRAVAALALQLAAGVPWLLSRELLASRRERLESLLAREWRLSRMSLIVDGEDLEGSAGAAVLALIERFPGMVVVLNTPQTVLPQMVRAQVHFELAAPERAKQLALWLDALASLGVPDSADAARGCAERFLFEPSQVRDAVRRGLAELPQSSSKSSRPEELSGALWRGALAASRGGFEGLAQRIEPRTRWQDLTLDEYVSQTLRAIIGHSRFESQVLGEWGFAQRYGRGLGISALFSGPSGTGKTSAAEVIAHALGLDLYRIDLAGIVSRWLGETEKNLGRVFDAAECGGAVLLFDEADALFARRTAVSSSHDRYANLEVSYLLQRMEAFQGVTILTTNLADNIDSAFARRMRFCARFSFPDQAARKQIWSTVFPAEAPHAQLDLERLSQLRVSGAAIRNIALMSAFWAAERGEPISMRALLEAARLESRKSDQPLTREELAGWPESTTQSGVVARKDLRQHAR